MLNTGMIEYLRGLRPRYRTAILSNAATGGRRVEQARYGFDALADVLRPGEAVFLDDLEANVAGARAVGMRAVRFRTTGQAVADVQAVLEEGVPG